MTEKILIEVYGGTNQGWGCNCSDCSPGSCGPTTPMEELVDRLAGELNDSHGEKVEVKYIDTDQSGLSLLPMISQVIEVGYPFPIIAVNGVPRLAGAINLDNLRKILDEPPEPVVE